MPAASICSMRLLDGADAFYDLVNDHVDVAFTVLARVRLRRLAPTAIQQNACRRHTRGRWAGPSWLAIPASVLMHSTVNRFRYLVAFNSASPPRGTPTPARPEINAALIAQAFCGASPAN